MTEELIEAYYTTRANKRRSADSVEFEINWERNLLRLEQDLLHHTFSPSAYTFIAPRPRPREVFACEMAMRIVHHYIDIRMRPLVENELTGRTFNNRVGYGTNEAVNALITDIYDVSKGFTEDAWIIKMDLKGYFPNADQSIVYHQLSDLLERTYDGEDKDIVHYMLARSIFSYPTEHCYRKSPLHKWDDIDPQKSIFNKPDGIGGAIGHLIWQNAMNYYLNELDHLAIDVWGLHYVRFVDDIAIVTDNKECALLLIPEIRKILKGLGCEMHPKKFYCQHYTKGVSFIGTTIKMNRVYVGKRVVRNARRTLSQFNRCPRPAKLQSFMSSMNSYLGIFKNRNAHGIAMDLIDHVNPEWWKYCFLNRERMCIQAKEGYRPVELLMKKYHFTLKKYGRNKTKNQSRGSKAA